MLPPRRTTSATRADYDEQHFERLCLIRSLTIVAGLPLNRVKRILDAINHPEGGIYDMLGRAVDALRCQRSEQLSGRAWCGPPLPADCCRSRFAGESAQRHR
jgi:DNA-binding transcriptional MerR regulator